MSKAPYRPEQPAAASGAATVIFAPHTTTGIDAGCG
jgi:hypothetical protein